MGTLALQGITRVIRRSECSFSGVRTQAQSQCKSRTGCDRCREFVHRFVPRLSNLLQRQTLTFLIYRFATPQKSCGKGDYVTFQLFSGTGLITDHTSIHPFGQPVTGLVFTACDAITAECTWLSLVAKPLPTIGSIVATSRQIYFLESESMPENSPYHTPVAGAFSNATSRQSWITKRRTAVMLIATPFALALPMRFWVINFSGWYDSIDFEPEYREFALFQAYSLMMIAILIIAFFPAFLLLWIDRWEPVLTGILAVIFGVLLIPAIKLLTTIFGIWV